MPLSVTEYVTEFPQKALIAMSGGVDSSVAAALMLDKGCRCEGLTLRLCESDGADTDEARQAADKLGIPHHVLDLNDAFRDRVILPFIKTYEEGATPNPCIACNRYIKFAFPFFRVRVPDFNIYATGHYARTEKSGSRRLLRKAADLKKDQSYVLFSLDQETLARVCFPLGDLSKSQVREIAGTRFLANAMKKESQDICFVPDGDYGAFMEQYTGKSYAPGDILDIKGNVIGRHRGMVRYTLGQRRGLGVAVNEPVYVSAKDPVRNTVTLGPESALYSKTLSADRVNLIACESLERPVKLQVKTRYLQQEHPAWVTQTGTDEIRVDFPEAQRALTPGQAAVFYDGDVVVGGGIIRTVGGE